MKQIIILLALSMPIMANAQHIKFSTVNNWEAALEQSRKEQKILFLDAVATWCAPCKRMDTEVYTDPKISDFVNANFIALKVQFDQTKNDSEAVKNWYEDAKKLASKYNINAYPTFLFLDSSGQVIEKGLGFQSVDEFLALLKKANDPDANYASIVAKYHQGKVKGQQLLTLALRAKKIADTAFANRVANEYRNSVLEKENPARLLNIDLRDFIVDFQKIFSLNDRLIKYLYTHQSEVDEKLNYKEFSQKVMSYLIDRDIITPFVQPNSQRSTGSPDWRALNKKIGRAYDSKIANRLTFETQIDWYKVKKDWSNVVKYTIAQLESEKLDTVGVSARSRLNTIAYELIFRHSNDPIALNKAIGYMELILAHNPERDTWIDTYANLLYKAGRKEEAIEQESKALSIAKGRKSQGNAKVYESTLNKMRKNEATWRL